MEMFLLPAQITAIANIIFSIKIKISKRTHMDNMAVIIGRPIFPGTIHSIVQTLKPVSANATQESLPKTFFPTKDMDQGKAIITPPIRTQPPLTKITLLAFNPITLNMGI